VLPRILFADSRAAAVVNAQQAPQLSYLTALVTA